VTIGGHEMGPADAAAALGLTVEQLLERAMDGNIPNCVLDADGWRFRRRSIQSLAERRAGT
jgi:hypothetical protein